MEQKLHDQLMQEGYRQLSKAEAFAVMFLIGDQIDSIPVGEIRYIKPSPGSNIKIHTAFFSIDNYNLAVYQKES